MIKYNVVEKFISINGEGTRAGQLAVFIRLKSCNLKCNYCDTEWANEDNVCYSIMTAEEIVDYVVDTKIKNVTITGGEPLLHKNISKLVKMLFENNIDNIEIETNGSISIKELKELDKKPVITMDYKLPNSKMESFMLKDNFNFLDDNDTVKFVVSSDKDLERMYNIILENNLIERCNVYVSPVYNKINPSDIVDYMKTQKLNGVNLQLQLHKIIWNPNKRGV